MQSTNQVFEYTMDEFLKTFYMDRSVELGSGMDASVWLAMHLRTSEYYAFKELNQKQIQSNYLANEIIILKNLNIQGVIQLIGHQKDYTSLILEYMPNDTFLKILKKGPLSEPIAKTLTLYLCQLIDTIHKQGIAHCDIKPENILISKEYQLKLCDFGFSQTQTFNHAPGGTTGYIAPEIFVNPKVDLIKCDIFALGVVIFIIWMGFPPFQNTQPQVRDQWWGQIQANNWEFLWQYFERIRGPKPPIFKKVIEGLLNPDFQNRISLNVILQNEFFQDGASNEDVIKEIKERVGE